MPGPVSQSYEGPRDSSPLTVDDVRDLVECAGKDWALVLSGDAQATQYTTWGRRPEHKVFASDLSEEISAWVNAGGSQCLSPATGPAKVLESFHEKGEAARNKAELERLRVVSERADTLRIAWEREHGPHYDESTAFGKALTELRLALLDDALHKLGEKDIADVCENVLKQTE